MSRKDEISFRMENDRLDGTVYYPDSPKDKNPAILFITGWTSERARYVDLAQMLTELGFVSLTFDMRGHGTSEGDINTQTRQDFTHDVFAAYEYLTGIEGVDPDDISVIGSSFGSYLGAVITGKRKVKRLAMRVPANYPDGNSDRPQAEESNRVELLKWRYQIKNPTDTMSLRALHNFAGPVLIVEAGADEIIPHQTVQNYVDAVKNKKKLTHIVMKNAPHSLTTPELSDQYHWIIYGWLENHKTA